MLSMRVFTCEFGLSVWCEVLVWVLLGPGIPTGLHVIAALLVIF